MYKYIYVNYLGRVLTGIHGLFSYTAVRAVRPVMAQSREALVNQADRLRITGQQLQEEVNVLKFDFNIILVQRNFYSDQIEYYGAVLRRLDENSARYQ